MNYEMEKLYEEIINTKFEKLCQAVGEGMVANAIIELIDAKLKQSEAKMTWQNDNRFKHQSTWMP